MDDGKYQFMYQPAEQSICHDYTFQDSSSHPQSWRHADAYSAYNLDLNDVSVDANAINAAPIATFTTPRDTQPYHPGTRIPDNKVTWPSPVVEQSSRQSYFESDSGYVSQSQQYGLESGQFAIPEIRRKSINPVTARGPRSRTSSAYAPSEDIPGGQTRRRSSAPVAPCTICTKVPRNKSDATKHAKTHQKPYKCQFTTCVKHVEGFGTTNDRERHELCVHGLEDRQRKGWVCAVCQRLPDGTRKWWPRRDNFTSHAKNRHKDLDVKDLVEKSTYDYRPDDTYSERDTIRSASNYQGGSRADSDIHYQDLSGQYQPGLLTRQASQPGETNPWLDSNTYSTTQRGVDLAHQADSASLLARSIHSGPCTARGQHKHPLFYAEPVSIVQNGGLSKFEELRLKNIHSLATRDQKRRRIDEDNDEQEEYECEHCVQIGNKGGKKFSRSCDLRKHKLRHERPYGCTEPYCYDKFGSKSDWKRHEESHHRCPQSWLCRIKDEAGVECGKYYNDAKWFKKHLEAAPHFFSGEELEEKMEQSCLPREGRGRFWCGFCRDVILNNGDSRNTNYWEVRCKHIGQHMDRSGQYKIGDWWCPSLQRQKGSVTKEERDQPRPLPPRSPLTRPISDKISYALASKSSNLSE